MSRMRRYRGVTAAALAVLALLLAIGAPSARAQDDPTPPSAAADAGSSDDAPEGMQESFLRWMARSSGPIGVVLLLMSFYMIALVVWMFFEYRRGTAVPERLVGDLNNLLVSKQYTPAFDRLARDESFLGRVLAAGVRKLPNGQPAAYRAMQLVNDDVTMEMEHRTTALATIGTLGPLIGLFGTVYGMIIAFRVMSASGQPQADQLAGGISTALFATLLGIGVAIPAITFYAFFRNRIARLSMEVELAAEAMIEQFAPAACGPRTRWRPTPGR